MKALSLAAIVLTLATIADAAPRRAAVSRTVTRSRVVAQPVQQAVAQPLVLQQHAVQQVIAQPVVQHVVAQPVQQLVVQQPQAVQFLQAQPVYSTSRLQFQTGHCR